MRSLGGSIGLAVCVIVFNIRIRASSALAAALTGEQMTALLKSPLVISKLTPQEQGLVARVYAKAFTKEMEVTTYIAAACFVASVFTLSRNRPQPISAHVATTGEKAGVEPKSEFSQVE